MPLDYHKQIFGNCHENDGLVVMAYGLGIHHIILAFLKYYADSSDLVLYIDCQSSESLQNSYLYYTERLLNFGIKYSNLPTFINQDQSGTSKLNMYLRGGVFFGPSSIFVLDILLKRIPISMVSGIIVNNAHRISDTSLDYLLLKLFRQHNKNGFIKAFTTEPSFLVDEIGKLQRTMKYLHLTKVYLWPRFHQQVSTELDQHPPDLVELSIPLTDQMKLIDKDIDTTTKMCLYHLRSSSKVKELDDEQLFSGFDSVIQQSLKPVWSQLSIYSKQLISNIKLLKSLSMNLLSYDCVTFYHLLLMIKKSSDAVSDLPLSVGGADYQTWLETPEAENLFQHTRDRLFKTIKKKTSSSSTSSTSIDVNDIDADASPNKKLKTESNNNNNNNEQQKVMILEQNPKWNLLYQILQEIEDENNKSDTPGNILVFVKDERTVLQIQSFLNLGGDGYLLQRYNKFYQNHQMQHQRDIDNKLLNNSNNDSNSNSNGNSNNQFRFSNKRNFKNNRKQQISETNKKKKNNVNSNGTDLFNMGVSVVNNSPMGLHNIPAPRVIDIPMDVMVDGGGDGVGDLVDFYDILSPPYVIVHPIENSLNILDDTRPKFVIIYDPDISITRQIEVYKAENPGVPLRVYFITYDSSAEEKRYLWLLHREKTSFEKLIREKANLVIDTNQEGKQQEFDNSKLELLEDPALVVRNSRFGGKKLLPPPTTMGKKQVIIDSHEFKSSLPVVLHNNDFEIIPLRLEIGDYVITPTMAVERKSLSDLIGSFSSGRLYHQIEAMNRVYRNPILLIEFDQSQPFYLTPIEELRSGYISMHALSSKLVMLVKSFPRLRILWSRSSYSTTRLYSRLKTNQPEPDPTTIKEEASTEDTEFNYSAQDVLRSMPGINDGNIHLIMNRVQDLYHLSQMSLIELIDILKSEKDANLLYDFLTT
ncbi:hypothetical protein CYY_004151 [Polysphondylium violaceum]|uniref:ERCC4 domain-containing protein n=1 Tax=Polysphondylium violaceum TaxID=133409 RepID=A0A8J4PXE9_9MYCE|nr:hypothetical protein CYY_004151 [Polysphondylium violaceum]